MITPEQYNQLIDGLAKTNTTLIAVSKLKPVSDIQALYNLGQRDFGENYVQEVVEKQPQLPAGIRWHFIGHLQSNKIKYIAPFVHMIHGVDSFKLLQAINKEAAKCGRIISCLLQIHVAEEETKFGLDEKQAMELLEYYTAQKETLKHVQICGMMGMASFTEDEQQIENEFKTMHALFQICKQSYFLGDENFNTLSMGMSGDYDIAIRQGATHVRIGSMLFGNRS